MRPSLSLALPLLCTPLAAACGSDPDPKTISIETGAPPALIAFRHDGDTAWQTVAVTGATNEVSATGPYRVVVACEGPDSRVEIVELARTLDDRDVLSFPCGRFAPGPFTARGTLAQPGQVALGNATHISGSPGFSFELEVEAGPADLVMRSEDGRVAIRRDLQIAGDLQLGALDLAQEGAQQLVPTTFTAANARPGEVLGAAAILDTGNTFTFLELGAGPGWALDLVPDGLLRPTDHQNVLLYAQEAVPGGRVRLDRTIQRDVRAGTPAAHTLPEPLGPVSFEMTPDRLVATWSTLPAHDILMLSRHGFDGQRGWYHMASLSRRFIEETGAETAVVDLTSVPGFRDAWRVDPANEYARQLLALHGAETRDSESSAVYEDLAVPAARAADGGAEARIRELHDRALRTHALRAPR